MFETTAEHKWPTPTGTQPVQNQRKTSSVRNGCATVIPPKRFRPEFKDTGGSSHKRQNTTKRSSCCPHRASPKAPAYAMQQRTIPIKRNRRERLGEIGAVLRVMVCTLRV